MGKNERQAYLKAIRSRYWRAGKKAKVTILNEFCAVCGYNRKYAIRLLNQRTKPMKKRLAGRKPIYAGFVAKLVDSPCRSILGYPEYPLSDKT